MEKIKSKIINLLSKSRYLQNTRYFFREDYENAKQEFFDKIEYKLDTIKSIYQVVDIEVTGLSDIDIFIIFKDWKRDNIYNYHQNQLSPESRYLFCHNGWLVDEYAMVHLPHWFPYSKLSKVYGEDLEIGTKEKTDSNLDLILLVQYLLRKIPFDLIRFSYASRVLNEKVLIALVNTMRHTLRLVNSLAVDTPVKWELFCQEYVEFRKNFFQYEKPDRKEKLFNFSADAIIIAAEIIKYVSDNIISNVVAIDSDGLLRRRNVSICFKETNIEEILNSFTDKRLSRMIFPRNFAFYPYLWKKSSGRVGNSISRDFRFSGNIKINAMLEDYFSIHVKVLEHYNEFSISKFGKVADGYHILWTPMYNNFLFDTFDKGYKMLTGILSRELFRYRRKFQAKR